MPESFIEEIFSEGEKLGVKPKDDVEKEQTAQTLRKNLKALVARDLWTMTEYFRIYNEENAIHPYAFGRGSTRFVQKTSQLW